MAQITEDYCSFELSKLLKEKGFNASKIDAYFPFVYYSNRKMDFYDDDTPLFVCEAVTLQLAMKWLIEAYNLSVEVYRTACGYIGCIVNIPSGTDIKLLEENGDDKASGQYTKPELATEDAIKYCLEYLI